MAEVVQTKSSTINEVQIDSLALLKIVRHCKEGLPDLVSGTLLGVDVDGVLEISNCFPQVIDGEYIKDERFVLDMIQAFAKVNCVASNVGWYQAAYLSEYLTFDFISDQYNYQTQIPASVCIVYDPYTTEKGRLPIKAMRLTASFMELYTNVKMNAKTFQKFNIKSSNIFEELPVKVKTSALAQAFVYEMNVDKVIPSSAERLNTSNGALIEKLIEVVSGSSGCIDDYSNEQEKYRAYQASLSRQKLELTKRIDAINEENERRKRNGRELLPVPDLASLSKISEPSRLDSLAVTSRIDMYGQELSNLAYASYTNQAILASFMKAGATDESQPQSEQ